MRCPVEVNEMLTQTPHFLLTIVLTFVIAALLALRQESNPILKIDTVPSAFCGRETPTTCRRQGPLKPNSSAMPAGTSVLPPKEPPQGQGTIMKLRGKARCKRPKVG